MAEPAAKKAFIIGHPVAHSRSPLIHGHWLKELGIGGSYERIDIAPQALAGFVRTLPESGFAGGNVTIPHKEAVLELADRIDDVAEQIGAVNTLWIEDGRVHGTNTDAIGFSADLDLRAPEWRQAGTALVLGAGGAARAILFALKAAGIAEIRLVNRTRARAQELADRFGPGISIHGWEGAEELASGAGLVVNTTALGMHGAGMPPVDVTRLPPGAIVADIIYTPLVTPLLGAAQKSGLQTVDGLGMLLHQAVPGFKRWFGKQPVVTQELRALVVADLADAA